MPLSLDRVILGSLFTECILYGVCVTMGSVTALVLVKAHSKGGRAHGTLLLTLLLMLILATSHVALSFAEAFLGFIVMRDFPGGPSAYFTNMPNSVLVAKTALYPFQTLLGDTVYVWRCYVIWGRDRKIILVPVLTLLASFICACIIEKDLTHSLEDVFGSSNAWVISGFTLLLGTAIYCNVAIVYRIWIIDRRNRSHILIVIVEAGLFYTSSLIMFLVFYLTKSTGQRFALDLIIPFVPIVFCLIILQIRYHSTDEVVVSLDAPRRPWTGAVRQTFQGRKRHAQPVEINILTSTENYLEGEAADVPKNGFFGVHGGSESTDQG
ncbi:hypothetical protein DENSPDRAFT_844933 [Dentipellis sp. KUC8613]|nr:hypothetical protein DENSPDRAFT_844933 [Dentipellis sp. KUC8613]